MNANFYLIQVIAVMALATSICRFSPFLIPSLWLGHPAIVSLSWLLPTLILVVLVVNEVIPSGNWVPYDLLGPVISVSLVICLHVKWRNALLSITIGTIAFMATKNWHQLVGG